MRRAILNQLLHLLLIAAVVPLSSCVTRRAYQSGRGGLLDDSGERNVFSGRGAKVKESFLDLDEAHDVRAHIQEAGFRWPLARVQVTSAFGPRGDDMHEGVDLRASSGTPVYATAPGTVLYAGNQIRGYGRLVVLRHPGGLSSIYAHNSKLLVIRGQKVRGGQQVARSGNTGHSSGPHVHFEIRKGVSPMDPERAIGRRLVAIPGGELKASSKGRLAEASFTRDDSGRPPVSGLSKRAPGHKYRKVATRPRARASRQPARHTSAKQGKQAAPKRVSHARKRAVKAKARTQASKSRKTYPATQRQ